jgi:NADH:ubiquinone oxidoreductase subunit K
MIQAFGDVTLYHYLILSAILFSIGAFGLMISRNAVKILMCVEIMINAANINLVAFSSYSSPFNLSGQIFTTFSIAIAAAEAAIGLAIFIVLYRRYSTIDVDEIDFLRW